MGKVEYIDPLYTHIGKSYEGLPFINLLCLFY